MKMKTFGGWLAAMVTDNLGLKLISLAFALVLYSIVHGSQDAQRSLDVGVVALTPAKTSNRELVTAIPGEIRVTISGLRSTLNELHADDIGSISLDLRSGNVQRITFDPSMIPLPPGLKVERFEPASIDLRWEERVAKNVPVEVGVVGNPAPGFVVDTAPKADPAQVLARGPQSQVVVLQRARTEPFDVTGLQAGRYTRQLALVAPPPRVTFNAANVSAIVDVHREIVERLFAHIPVLVVGHPKARARPADVDVRLGCPPEVVRTLRADQIVPRVQIGPEPEHGSDVLPVELGIAPCTARAIPSTVVVRW